MKISVYITSYNQKEYLKVAVDSVLAQTLQPYEIVIVDDCSSDGSQEVINEYCEAHPSLIKAHFNNENKGITKSRNVALSLVTGEYTTWLDGDDKYLPEKLEVQAKVVRQSGADVVYTNFYYSKSDINEYHRIWCSNRNELPSSSHIYFDVIARNFPQSTLFRYELVQTDLLKNVGGYDEQLKIYEDFDFRIRLTKNSKVSYSFLPLSVYRLHEEGLSRAKKDLHLDSLKYIYSKYESDVQALPEPKRTEIQSSIQKVFAIFEPPKQLQPSLISRIKGKLLKWIRS
ncbi:MAG: glycosyltransferase family 2 protein [Bacteroidota bacterium]